MKRKDFIHDYETLSIDRNKGVIIDCSVFIFDWGRFGDKPYTFEELINDVTRFKVDVREQMKNYDYEVDKKTLKFWEEQAPDVRKLVMPSDDDLTLDEFTTAFFKYIRKEPEIKFWWSRNNTFDPVITARVASDTGKTNNQENLLPYWGVRDIKTWIDAKFNFDTDSNFVPISDEVYWKENFKPHNSTHDVAADVMRLQTIYRAENEFEQVSR